MHIFQYKARQAALNRGAMILLSEILSYGLDEASLKDFSNETFSCFVFY